MGHYHYIKAAFRHDICARRRRIRCIPGGDHANLVCILSWNKFVRLRLAYTSPCLDAALDAIYYFIVTI